MAPKSRNTAVVSPILLLLLLWSSSSTLRGVDGLFIKVCSCSGVYTPPSVFSNCSSYLVYPCPCPGEPQSSNEIEFEMQIVPSRRSFNIHLMEKPLDGVSYSLTTDDGIVVSLGDASVQQSPGKHELAGSEIRDNTPYRLTFCGWLNSTLCGCSSVDISTVDEFTPGDFDVLDVMRNEFKATWNAPFSPTLPSRYVLMYRPLGSQETTTMSYRGATIPNAVIGNLLPTTTYSVQVRAEFTGNRSGTTGEFIVTTEADNPLAVQIFQNQLYSTTPTTANPTSTSTIFITEIIGDQCTSDIGTILRNTQFFQDFYEIRNVNHNLTSFGYDLQLRRIYYTTTEHSIYSMSYTEGQVDDRARFLGEGQQLILDRGKAVRSLQFDWSSGRLYWIEDNATVVTSLANGSDVRTVFNASVTVHDFELDPTHGYLYWLSSGQVRRCPLNLEVNCREKEELIPTELSTVNDFALNTSSLETVLYRVNGSHLSVSVPDPGDMETLLPLNVSSAQTVLVSSVNLIILEEDKPFEVRNENLEVICARSTAERGDVDVSVLDSQDQLPFSPPNPPSGFTFTITATSVNVSWLSPSAGVPSFSKCAPWRYRVEYNIDNGMQQSEVVTDTYFSRLQLTPGDPFTVRVIAEGQPGYSSTSPRFTVVPQSEADQMPLPLLLGTRSGLYRYDFREHAMVAGSQTRVVSVARDVLRNVTYILRDIGDNSQIGVVRDGSYSVLFERSNVESLTVDWVANKLYWIEGGTVIMAGSTDPNRRERSTLMSTGPFTHLATDSLQGLLFISNGTTVTFQKGNNRPPQDSNVCSCKLDRILAMTADPDSQRIFWVSLRYSRLILNWASYTRETCNNSGQAVIPELELNVSMPRCVLAVSKGLLALKVENVNKIWTAPVALFESLQVSSSPWLRPFSLPTGVDSAEEIYDFVFEQSNTAGLTPDVSAIPGAPSPIPSDGNAALDAITIQWSSVPFTASPLLYNVAYTLTRTNDSVESGSESTAMTSVVLDNQTPYTNVKVTINAVSYWGSSADVTYSFRSTSAAPTDAVKNVTVSVYRARRGSDAVSVLVQWGLLTAEQLRGEGIRYRVEVLQQGQSVVNVSFPPDRGFGFLSSNSFQSMSNALYELQVYAVTEFPTVSGMEIGLSPPSDPVQFNSSAITPPLEVLLNDGSLLGDEQAQLDLGGPLAFDALLRTYYGFVERDGTSFLSSLSISSSGGTQELTAIPSGTQVMSLVLDWISKDLYLLSTQGGQLVVHSWSTQGGQSLQTVYSNGTSLTEVTGRISPFSGTLYYALTASGGTTLYALDVREQGSRMPSRIFPGMPNGRRRRQACPDPPSFDLGQGFTTDANGRAWMSSTDTGDIWSCAVSGTQLCNCMSEVSNASTSVQALAVDEARVYWTDTNGVFYVELDSNRNVFITLSTMATTQLLATSPGLQQLPEDSCLYPQVDQQPAVQVSSVTNSTVFLTWSPAMLPSNCTQVVTSLAPLDYTVEYSPSGQNTISVLSNFNTSITLTGLLAYTNYSVRVSGRNIFTPATVTNNLFGARSPFTTLPGVPDPPVSLSVVNFGTRALKATWLPPSEVFDDVAAVRYRITASADSAPSQTIPASSQEQVISGLEPGTMYTVQVVTVNSMHSSSPAEDSATTWALPPTLDYANVTNTSVLLTAAFPDLATPIQQVVLQQNIDDAWQNVSGVKDVQSTVTFMRMDLEPFEMYSYRLYGVYETLQDGTTHSAAGEATNFRSQSGVPSVPVLLQPEGNVLRWDRLDDNGAEIIQLVISFKRTNGDPSENVTIQSPGDRTTLDTSSQQDIDNNVQYNVTMVAVNAIGASQPSKPILFTRTSEPSTSGPDPPLPLQAIIALAVVGGVVILVFIVIGSLCLWCCCIHWENLKRREAIQHIAGNPNYDADLERLRVLKFSRDDYRSRVDYIYNGNDLERLEKFARDKITLDKLLGEGAFGEVIAGTLQLPDEPEPVPVAIKVLHKDATEEQNRTFLSEAIIMSHFNHENVLRVIGVCINNTPNFILLELMGAGNLLQFLRQAKRSEGPNLLTPIELVKASLDVAKGAKYLEALKFIHRDLAARNCLVSSYGEERVVKIADFGLARDLYSQEYYRKEGQGLLPIRWMPPESLQEGLFTTKSDVWSFGVTLWEIWTMGHQPYPARTNHEVFEFVIHGGRNEKVEGMSNYMYNIMTQCWQQNPEDRPTFFQLADKLKSHHERMKCASVCIDDDLSDIEEEGEFKRGDSNRSWLRGSLRDSMRRIRTSIHRQNSLRAIRRQSSFKSDTSGQHNNGQVSSSSADNLLESAFKESGPI